MTSLVIEVSAVKMAMAKGLVLELIKINGDGMHIEIDLIKQDIKVLLHLAMMVSEIRFFKIVLVYLLCCLAIFASKDKYLLIFYHKYFQLF